MNKKAQLPSPTTHQATLPPDSGLCGAQPGWVGLSRGLTSGVAPAFHPPHGQQAQLGQKEDWVLTSFQKSPLEPPPLWEGRGTTDLSHPPGDQGLC